VPVFVDLVEDDQRRGCVPPRHCGEEGRVLDDPRPVRRDVPIDVQGVREALAEDPGNWILAEVPAAYRPRHPGRAGFYQLFETHFDSYVRAYEE
jgi:hypothetical protein